MRARLDALGDVGARETDPAKGNALIDEPFEIQRRELPVILLLQPKLIWAAQANVDLVQLGLRPALSAREAATAWNGSGRPMCRTLIPNGTVLSMSPGLGELAWGDVVIEGDRVAAVGLALEAADAEVVDAEGCIIVPGRVHARIHT